MDNYILTFRGNHLYPGTYRGRSSPFSNPSLPHVDRSRSAGSILQVLSHGTHGRCDVRCAAHRQTQPIGSAHGTTKTCRWWLFTTGHVIGVCARAYVFSRVTSSWRRCTVRRHSPVPPRANVYAPLFVTEAFLMISPPLCMHLSICLYIASCLCLIMLFVI